MSICGVSVQSNWCLTQTMTLYSKITNIIMLFIVLWLFQQLVFILNYTFPQSAWVKTIGISFNDHDAFPITIMLLDSNSVWNWFHSSLLSRIFALTKIVNSCWHVIVLLGLSFILRLLCVYLILWWCFCWYSIIMCRLTL